MIQRRIETCLPATRYFWPISPRGDEPASTFSIVVSGMIDLHVADSQSVWEKNFTAMARHWTGIEASTFFVEEAESVLEQIMTTVVVFGGAGFLGRRLVHRLTAEGMAVRVAVRHPDSARIELRAIGLGRVTAVPADVRDQASVAAAIAGADAVVNTVSAYVEKSGVTFEAMHGQGAGTVVREAVAAGVARFVLVSGIGADADSRSPYIRARDVSGGYDRAPGRHVWPGRCTVQHARRARPDNVVARNQGLTGSWVLQSKMAVQWATLPLPPPHYWANRQPILIGQILGQYGYHG
jgi:NAD(P)H-binding